MYDDEEGPGAVAQVTTKKRPGGLGFLAMSKSRPKRAMKPKKKSRGRKR